MAVASCSGVPVARISIGLATDAPGKSFDLSSSAASPVNCGTCSPPFDKASVSMTPGPPAWVTMAKLPKPFPPCPPTGGGHENMQPTVVSSSREKHLTIPALRKRASTAESLDAMAPVCDDAALLPLSLEPLLMAAMRQPFLISELAWKSSLSGLEIFSTYNNFIVGSVSGLKFSSIYCNTSSIPICLPLPIDQTELNCNPFITADSRMNTAVAPEPLIKSTPLGLRFGIGLVNTL